MRKRKFQRFLSPAIALGFGLLWLLSIAVLWNDWQAKKQLIEHKLHDDAEAAMQSKADHIERILQQIYYITRTISLIPAIRSVTPGNRESDSENVVEQGRFSAADYDTVQQLYNQIATSVDLSEIYIVYDGFDPERGQVPFMMFDHVIVDNFQKIAASLKDQDHDENDIPEESEEEEYQDYVRQLNYLRQHYYSMPGDSLDNILPINSGLLRTCDNTQYISKKHGDVNHAYGFTLSVPIYDLKNYQFKGLVTGILRKNVIEATLIGWPVLPVTENDRQILNSTPNLDLNSEPVNFLLEEQTHGIRISDSRNSNFDTMRKNAVYHVQTKLGIPGSSLWVLHNYVPSAALNAAMKAARIDAIIQISILSLVLFLLWLAVNAVLKAQFRNATKLRKLAEIDSLTGLPNRRMIGRYMTNILNETADGNYSAAIMIDLDDFKHVNDSLGHEAGDRMLIEVSHRFTRVLREDDHVLMMSNLAQSGAMNPIRSKVKSAVGRLGGDEFLVILGNLPGADVAGKVAARLLASSNEPLDIGMEKIYSRISIGIAVYPDDGEDMATLLRSADIAVYEAKRRGRGQIVKFSPELNKDAIRLLQLKAALHEALVKDQFYLLYQPKMHLETGKINATEALIRWQHPEHGLVTPSEFIPILERTGLIVEVGRWILQTACLQFRAWKDMGLPLEHISVNISQKQLEQPDFAQMVAAIIANTAMVSDSLVLEVTESCFMENPELVIKTLVEIRCQGIKVAIDDFGTGYSSLSYLRKMPLDIVKIDRSFVNEINTRKGVAICKTLITLFNRLELKVVAEGIETRAQLLNLQDADWIQGFYISKPLLPDEFVDKVRDFSWRAEPENSALFQE